MKPTYIALILGALIIGLALFFSSAGRDEAGTPTEEPSQEETSGGANVLIDENGTQVITLNAKGGYSPRRSVATAGIPTILRFETTRTFDCSAAVRIPSLDITKMLPQSGATDIDIGTPAPGVFRGNCTMGMYPFEIEFR